ncbi:hypothetical protein FGIG_09427 [Fasciola gigantica]|uniref:EDR1/CTR1/ARMC3-like peptidase-like domain-containing protein n=1 Tax=Fasciola gigantica TaxID=46835 RepID=A0A504Z1N5_FASGI|nr:hypothetical protein FGIG_09427 [Fasciola gigantica]
MTYFATHFRGIKVLQDINASLSKRNGFSELALQRVFDANLEAKFVLTGYLDFADNIGGLFFDPGQLLSASEILTLEDYLRQPLNDKRPIYLINVRDMKDKEIDQSSDQPSSSITSEREVEEDASNVQPEGYRTSLPWTMCSKCGWRTSSQPFCHWLDRIVKGQQLAIQFVSSCYGGPVDKETLKAPHYELYLAEIKCALGSNVIPLGCIKKGSQFHRALLFKICSVEFKICIEPRRRNKLYIFLISLTPPLLKASKPVMTSYVVDLMTSPGTLMDSCSRQAKEYISILSS